MIIKGLEKQTLLDYPGKIACIVFTFGCNFRCGYCHNPELVFDDKRPQISEESILSFLDERKGFLEGVVITGGEPTLHKDLPEFMAKIKNLGYSVKLDTNGTNPEMLKILLERKLVDYIAMDIKAPLDEYERMANCEVDARKIEESIRLVKTAPRYEFRLTAAPGIFSEEQARRIGRWLDGSDKFCLQQFKGVKTLDPSFVGKKPFSKEEMEKFCDILRPHFKKCEIRGL